jgi:hypothetical protein
VTPLRVVLALSAAVSLIGLCTAVAADDRPAGITYGVLLALAVAGSLTAYVFGRDDDDPPPKRLSDLPAGVAVEVVTMHRDVDGIEFATFPLGADGNSPAPFVLDLHCRTCGSTVANVRENVELHARSHTAAAR